MSIGSSAQKIQMGLAEQWIHAVTSFLFPASLHLLILVSYISYHGWVDFFKARMEQYYNM